MEPKSIHGSPLSKWVDKTWKRGVVPYIILAVVAFFSVKIGVILTILWVGFRTEYLLACLRYGDTVNSRRLEAVEEGTGAKPDYELIHSRSG
jgi:hypothetical protein